MPTNKPWKLKALQMAKQGKSITRISKELERDWLEVHEYIRDKQGTKWSGWLGAKRYVTNRLNRMEKADDLVERKELKRELTDAINYLYYAGKKLSKGMDTEQ